jgi:hypothetical protein
MGCPALPPANTAATEVVTEDLTPEVVTEDLTPEVVTEDLTLEVVTEDLTLEVVEFRILAGSCVSNACTVCGGVKPTTRIHLGCTPWNTWFPIRVDVCGDCHEGPFKKFLGARTAEQPAGFGYGQQVIQVDAVSSHVKWTIYTNRAWSSDTGELCVGLYHDVGDLRTSSVLPVTDLVENYNPV